MSRKRVAIIPARGGSQRIPRKNIIDFRGKPMIAWTIEAAKKSELFDRIIVSTDSEEIAKVSLEWGAEVPFLRDAHADNYSPVSEATLHTLIQLEENGESFDEVVQLFAVCPLRNAEDIISAYRQFEKRQVPYLISCYKFTGMNPWWAVTLDEKGHPEWIYKETMKRSQDLPELFAPTGAIWIARVENLKNDKTFYGDGHIFWEMEWSRAIDIDNYEDVKLALALSKVQ